MRQFRYWSVQWHSRPNFRRLGNSGGNGGQVKRTMTTVLPRGTLERADQAALSPLGAGQCNLARTVANQSAHAEGFRETLFFGRARNTSETCEALGEKGLQQENKSRSS
jgi:hypothetical protein